MYSFLSRRLTTSPAAKAKSIALYATAMLLILHGTSTAKIYLILALNYYVALIPKSPVFARYWPALVIVGNMGLLFLNHKYEGYSFGGVLPFLGFLVSLTSPPSAPS